MTQALRDAATVAVQRELAEATTAHQRVAMELGARQAMVELGMEGLFDAEALVFLQGFAMDSIGAVTAASAVLVQDVARDAIRLGWPKRQVVAELGRVLTGVPLATLKTMARTETNRAANYGRYTGWVRSGVVQEKEVFATLDDRVRPDHLAANGDRVPIGEPFTLGAAAGYIMPPFGPNCRCSAAPVTRLSGTLGPSRILEDRQRRADALAQSMGLTGTLRHGPGALCLSGVLGELIPGTLTAEARHARSVARIWHRHVKVLEDILTGARTRTWEVPS